MKNKKPSLLDMECFVQRRTQKQTSVLSEEKAISSDDKVEETQITKQTLTEEQVNIKKAESQPVIVNDQKETVIQKPEISIKQVAKSHNQPITVNQPVKSIEQPVTSNAQPVTGNVQTNQPDVLQTIKLMLTEFAPNRDFLKEVIDLVTEQKAEILSLRSDLNKLKSKVDNFNVIADQKVEIQYLRNRINEIHIKINQMGDKKDKHLVKAQLPIDENYKTLILKNVIKMKDENGFSSLDVAKLFKKEGFSLFPPFEEWDENTVTQMYVYAKRKGMD